MDLGRNFGLLTIDLLIMLSDFSFAQDTLGFIIEGDVDTEALQILGKRIHETLIENKKMSLYLEDLNIQSFSSSSILTGFLFPFRYGNRFYKMALITDRWWIHTIGFIQNIFFSVKIRTFTTENRVDAMSWIIDR